MAINATVTPGKTFAPGETITTPKLNALGNPTIAITGTVATSDLAAGSVTAAKSQSDTYWYGTTGGTSTAYTLDLGASLRPASLANGVIVRAKLHVSCGASPTLTVTGASGSALTTKEIRKPADAAVVASDFVINQIVDFTYNTDGDGGNGAWIIQTIPNANVAGAPIVANGRNLICINNVATPATKVDINADSIVLVDVNNSAFLATSVDLTIDATTTGANGFDANTLGTLGIGWYYLWVIYNSPTATTSGLISPSATTPSTLNAPHTHKALVGAVYATSTTNIRRFYQYERDIYIAQTELIENLEATAADTWELLAGATLTAFRTAVPPIAKICTMIWSIVNDTTMGLRIAVAPCSETGTLLTSATDLIGTVYVSIPAVAAVWTMAGNAYGPTATLYVPVRGGSAAYNIQWACLNDSNVHRIEVTAFKI